MCDDRLWSLMASYLKDKYELVFLKIPHTTNFDEMAEILNNEIKEDNINLVGFSLGGYTSLYFSLKYPNKVAKIFLIAASGSVSSQEEINRRKKAMIDSRAYDFCAPSKEKINGLIDENSKDDNELIELIQDMFITLGREVFEMQLQATFERENLLEKIINSEKPLNIIYGNNDRLVDDKWIENLKNSRNKNLNILCLDTTSHNIPLDFPKQSAEFIIKN